MPRSFADKAALFLFFLMLLGLLLHLFLPGGLVGSPLSGREFEPQKWIQVGPQERGPMAQDLVDSHLYRGLTSHMVQNLLGPPDPPLPKAMNGEGTGVFWILTWQLGIPPTSQ